MDSELRIGATFDTNLIKAGMEEATVVTEQATNSMSGFFVSLAASVKGFGASMAHSMEGAAEAVAVSCEVMEKSFEEAGVAAGVCGAAVNLAFGGVGAIIAFVAVLGELFTSLVETNIELGHLSAVTGINITYLAGLQQVTKEMGGNFEAVAKGLTLMTVSLSKAAGGNKELQAAFKTLGVSMEDIRSKSPEEIFRRVSAAVKESTNVEDRNAAAKAVLSRGFASLVPLMKKYGDGIDEVAKKTGDQTGVTEESEQAALRWTATWAKATMFMKAALVPVIEHTGDVLHGLIGICDAVGTAVLAVIETVVASIQSVITISGALANVLVDLAKGDPSKAWADSQEATHKFVDNWKKAFGLVAVAAKDTAKEFHWGSHDKKEKEQPEGREVAALLENPRAVVELPVLPRTQPSR